MNKLLTGAVLAGLSLCSFAADIPLNPEDFNVSINKAGFSADGGTMTLAGRIWLTSKKEIPYVEGKTYGLKCDIQAVADTPDNFTYVGFIPYDENHREIASNHANTVSKSETKLVADVKADDTFITVEDGSKWIKGSVKVAFNAKEDLSDLPNRNISASGVTAVEKVENGWKITLNGRVGKTAKAGDMVREQRDGGYVYIAYGNNSKGIVNPAGKIKKFYPGTKFIRAIVLGNWTPVKDPQPKLTIKNFCVTEE